MRWQNLYRDLKALRDLGPAGAGAVAGDAVPPDGARAVRLERSRPVPGPAVRRGQPLPAAEATLARYGVIADVHGNLQALEAVLRALNAQAVQDILCLGDLVGYNADSDACVELLHERRAVSIAGNHDLIALGQLGFDYCAPNPEFSLRRTRRRLQRRHPVAAAHPAPQPAGDDGVALIHGALDEPDPLPAHRARGGRRGRSLRAALAGGAAVLLRTHPRAGAVPAAAARTSGTWRRCPSSGWTTTRSGSSIRVRWTPPGAATGWRSSRCSTAAPSASACTGCPTITPAPRRRRWPGATGWVGSSRRLLAARRLLRRARRKALRTALQPFRRAGGAPSRTRRAGYHRAVDDAVPAIEVQAVGKRFPGVVALDGVSFTVPGGGVPGAVRGKRRRQEHAGQAAGGHPRRSTRGSCACSARRCASPVPADARRAGVTMVHQELAFADNLSIAENLCLAQLPRRWGFVDRRGDGRPRPPVAGGDRRRRRTGSSAGCAPPGGRR